MNGDVCDWPHVIMSPEEERAVTAMIERFGPFIEQCARTIAAGVPQLVGDLEQEARILLWRWGVARVAAVPVTYVRTAIVWRMQNVRNVDLSRAVGEAAGGDEARVA